MTIETTFGEQKPTYFVMREGGRAPRHRHSSRFLAEKEAERLAVKFPDVCFHVVKLKKSIISPSQPTSTDSTIEQARRRAGQMYEGDAVKIVPTHHLFPGKLGVIESIDMGTETERASIMVMLVGHASPRKFAPGSLMTQGTRGGRHRHDAAPERAPAVLLRELGVRDLVNYEERGVTRQGEVISKGLFGDPKETRYRLRDIIDNITMPRLYTRDELSLTKQAKDRPTPDLPKTGIDSRTPLASFLIDLLSSGALQMLSGSRATHPRFPDDRERPVTRDNFPGRFIEPGSECVVLVSMTLTPVAAGVKATLVRHDPNDDRLVWCSLYMDEDPLPIDASRVFALDDPRVISV